MACAIAQGSEIDCRDSIGGIAEVYITEYANVPQANITASSGTITAMTCSSTKKFWTFKLEKEVAEFIEKEVASVENGTLYYEQTLNFNMKKMSASNRNNIRNITQNRCLIIVKDNNGKYWLMGQTLGADKVGGTNEARSGKAMGDLNGYMLSFLGKEPSPANEVTAALLTTLTVAA